MMPLAAKFTGLNFAVFASEFTVHCLQRGMPGFILMKRHVSNDPSLRLDKIACSSQPGFDEIAFDRDKQLLFYDLMSSFTPNAQAQLNLRLREEGRGNDMMLALDCTALWDEMRDMHLWYTEISTAIHDSNHKSLGYFSALKSMANGDYIRKCWISNTSPSDLLDDIVYVSSNQALICALVLTISLPLFVESADFDPEIYAAQIYTLFMGIATCAEAVAILVCLRNIMAVKMVEVHNIHKYTELAHNALLLPNKLNVLAVVSLIIALLTYGYWKFGTTRFVFFLVVVVIPSMTATNFYIACGIKALFAVQPWGSSGTLPAQLPSKYPPVDKGVELKKTSTSI